MRGAAQVWANSADDPQNCSFILPAVARRGLVTVAVSTGGASPALAGTVRSRIAEQILTRAGGGSSGGTGAAASGDSRGRRQYRTG